MAATDCMDALRRALRHDPEGLGALAAVAAAEAAGDQSLADAALERLAGREATMISRRVRQAFDTAGAMLSAMDGAERAVFDRYYAMAFQALAPAEQDGHTLAIRSAEAALGAVRMLVRAPARAAGPDPDPADPPPDRIEIDPPQGAEVRALDPPPAAAAKVNGRRAGRSPMVPAPPPAPESAPPPEPAAGAAPAEDPRPPAAPPEPDTAGAPSLAPGSAARSSGTAPALDGSAGSGSGAGPRPASVPAGAGGAADPGGRPAGKRGRWAARLAAGLCGGCGAPSPGGYSRCADCRRARAAGAREDRRALAAAEAMQGAKPGPAAPPSTPSAAPAKPRPAAAPDAPPRVCSHCTRPAAKGRTRCEKCLAVNRAYIRRRRAAERAAERAKPRPRPVDAEPVYERMNDLKARPAESGRPAAQDPAPSLAVWSAARREAAREAAHAHQSGRSGAPAAGGA